MIDGPPHPWRSRILRLARLSLRASRRGEAGAPGGFRDKNAAAYLAPMATLALGGDRATLANFTGRLVSMAAGRWGLDRFAMGSGLGDAFCMRSVVEAWRGLVEAGLVGSEAQARVAPWLYELARIRCDGSIERLPGFEAWHQRNQNVPAIFVMEAAAFLERHPAGGRWDTVPLWRWADRQMVGWDLAWRGPDDSWLYQAIWTWGAYRHAALRRPSLLRSANARRSFDFFRRLMLTGATPPLFGESRGDDFLGPLVAMLVGARLFRDGELLWLAQATFARAEADGVTPMLVHRGPEFYRIWSEWPRGLAPRRPAGEPSFLYSSPRPGRGWSLGGTPYNARVKRRDARFPGDGVNDHDGVYQVRNPRRHRAVLPDKILFRGEASDGGLCALVDLRAQGLHDHPDALGVATLVSGGVPWLVETAYVPRGFNRQRWLHNVPLFRRGMVGARGLECWRSDTWREPAREDVVFRRGRGWAAAMARLRVGAFDYVPLDGSLFDVERFFLFAPGRFLAVVDRLTAARAGMATVGQAWHTTAQVEGTGNALRLAKRGQRLHVRFVQSRPMEWRRGRREPPERDSVYFDAPITDLLCHGAFRFRKGEAVLMAACFSQTGHPLGLEDWGDGFRVACGGFSARVGGFGRFRVLKP